MFFAVVASYDVREQQEGMELCLGVGRELPQGYVLGLGARPTRVIDVAVGVCYRLRNQGELGEAFFSQLDEVSHLQALLPIVDFNHPNTCWRDSTKAPGGLWSVDDNFLAQIRKSRWGGIGASVRHEEGVTTQPLERKG